MTGVVNIHGTFFGTEEHEERMRASFRRRAARVGFSQAPGVPPTTNNKKKTKDAK
jgi:hypothetical protein